MEMIYQLDGIDCANCAAKLERAIGKLKSVKSASLTFMTGRLIVEADGEEAREDILAVIKKREPDVVVTPISR